MFFHDLSGYSVYTYETIICVVSVSSCVFVSLCHNMGTDVENKLIQTPNCRGQKSMCYMKYLSLDDWQIMKNNMVKNLKFVHFYK
jgi:hypothetical protein